MIIFKMKALLATCKPLILLDFHRSFNDTPTKKVLFSCENSTFSFKGKNIIEDELQFRVKVQFHYFYFMTLPPRALLGAAVF